MKNHEEITSLHVPIRKLSAAECAFSSRSFNVNWSKLKQKRLLSGVKHETSDRCKHSTCIPYSYRNEWMQVCASSSLWIRYSLRLPFFLCKVRSSHSYLSYRLWNLSSSSCAIDSLSLSLPPPPSLSHSLSACLSLYLSVWVRARKFVLVDLWFFGL